MGALLWEWKQWALRAEPTEGRPYRSINLSVTERWIHFESMCVVVTSAINLSFSPNTVVRTTLTVLPFLTKEATAFSAPSLWLPAKLAFRVIARGNPAIPGAASADPNARYVAVTSANQSMAPA